jgi:hypothetical protein
MRMIKQFGTSVMPLVICAMLPHVTSAQFREVPRFNPEPPARMESPKLPLDLPKPILPPPPPPPPLPHPLVPPVQICQAIVFTWTGTDGERHTMIRDCDH